MAFFVPLIMAAASAATSKLGQKKSNATDTLRSVQSPELKDLQVKLQEYVQQGILRPEEAQTIIQEQSAYETISTDPRLRGSQIDALGGLERTAAAGGLDAMAMAGLEDALGRQRTESRGQQGAIMANARARGIGGSDLEMVNRMIAQQQQATAGSRAALDTAAIGQQRKDQALRDAADLSGNIRGMDYQQAADKAAAADAISRFNAANRQDQTNLNVGARNAAQAVNLGEKQRIADGNINTRNEQSMFNAQQPLNLYQAKLGQAGKLADAQDAKATLGQKQGEQAQAGFASTFGSIMDAFTKKKAGQ